MIVWLAVGALPASATAGEIELFDFSLPNVLAPPSRLLQPGMHVHDCGDALDVYVTERVPLRGSMTVASRKARLQAFRTLAAFAYGRVGTREQDVTFTESETLGGEESASMSIRDRVETTGIVAGLQLAARILYEDSLLMVFVLPLSGEHPTADCLP